MNLASSFSVAKRLQRINTARACELKPPAYWASSSKRHLMGPTNKDMAQDSFLAIAMLISFQKRCLASFDISRVGSNPIVETTNHKPIVSSAVHFAAFGK